MNENIIPLTDPEDERDRVWEKNHKKISECISKALEVDGRMPSVSALVSATGLNRKTVKNHINEFNLSPAFKEESGKYQLMVGEIVNKLCTMALNKNVKAARLFMELMGMLKTNHVVNNNFINGQTNYLEVNSVKITPEVIKGLSHIERVQIEDIISSSIHNKKVEAALVADAKVDNPGQNNGGHPGKEEKI